MMVSIIIPTYKNRGGLKRAIDSVLIQDYTNTEIIVVDDNDPGTAFREDTERIMCEYENNPKVRYIKHISNKNGAAARNTGIKNAKGDYIAFLDDDDWFLQGKIRKQVDFLDINTNYQAVYCQAIRNGRVVASNLPEGNLSKELLLLQTHLFTPTLMFRKASLLVIHGFDESFRRHQDFELLLKFFRQGYKIGVVQEPLIVIGPNLGENIPRGIDAEKAKRLFLNMFEQDVNLIDVHDKGFKNRVYAVHFGGVFIAYIKIGQILQALRVFNNYFWLSPIHFFKPLLQSALYHIINFK